MIHVSQFSGHSFRIKATAVSNVGLSNSLIRPLANAAYASLHSVYYHNFVPLFFFNCMYYSKYFPIFSIDWLCSLIRC